ncbi:MAG: zf-HC2 domain-containing protein [Anaerolineae bacterium]|nr:zf-HC2 domain-containing protein [Anaerolineae bacterium]
MMNTLRCQYVQSRIAAFVNNECTERERRIVGQHLDKCSTCEAAYRKQRGLQRDIKRDLPRMGSATSGQLNAIWQRIEQDLATPTPQPTSNALRMPSSTWHYGLVAAMAVILLTLAWFTDSNSVYAAVPSQPAPQDVVEPRIATPVRISNQQSVAIAFATEYVTENEQTAPASGGILHNTPRQTPEPVTTQTEVNRTQ